MPDAIACPDAGPIACSILQVAEALNADPTSFEFWGLLVLPAITALGTLIAVLVSVVVSLSARKQAQESEKARQDTEDARNENEREQRLQAALGDFMTEIPAHFAAMRKYEYENLRFQRFQKHGGSVVVFPPPEPSTIGLTTRLATSELNTTREEGVFIEAMKNTVTWHESKKRPHSEYCLRRIPPLVVDWVRSAEDGRRKAVVSTLNRLAASPTEEDAKQIWREYVGGAGASKAM